MTSPDNPYKKVYLTSKFGHTKQPESLMYRFDENNNEVEDGEMYARSDDELTGQLEDHHQLLLEEEDADAMRAAGLEMGLEGMASDEDNLTFNNEDYIYNEDDEGEQQVDEFFYEDYNENEDDRGVQDSYDKYSTLLDGMLLFGRLLNI